MRGQDAVAAGEHFPSVMASLVRAIHVFVGAAL
jgi:hypothetical protein